jgi:hypothetical protein
VKGSVLLLNPFFIEVKSELISPIPTLTFGGIFITDSAFGRTQKAELGILPGQKKSSYSLSFVTA